MRVAIYARVSTIHNGQDPKTQLLPLREYVQRRSLAVFEEYVDVTSGVKESRPSLDKLLADAKKRKFDAVIVWKLDRLGRSLKHLITLIDEFQALGVQFISYTEGMDTTTPSGKLLFNVIGAIAGFERDLIRERVKAGLERVKSQGKQLGRPNIVCDDTALKQMHQDGKNMRMISRETGLSLSTVQRRIHSKNQVASYARQ
jgi:DNA invertase Pin-like site-specific DNA recombinase